MINRRQFLAMASATMSAPLFAKAASSSLPAGGQFPDNFLWGAASAGHQVEGNNVNSDIWLLENVKPTLFKEQSGDACNSFELWETDLDLCSNLGFSAYRFSIEWARIEPEPGLFSQAMIDHYKRIIDGCHKRNMAPLVSFNHFASPVWFAARGGWTNPEAPALFANYCSKVSGQLADGIGYAVTFNEPNLLRLLKVLGIPPFVWDMQEKMLAAAGKATQSEHFTGLNAARLQDLDVMNPILIEGHKAARQAIKAERTNLDVGFTLAMLDDQSAGPDSVRSEMRKYNYGDWLKVTETDFIGVQNYEKVVWDKNGHVPTPDDAEKNHSGSWIDASSLANCVAYTYAETGKPILVTEHGIGTEDDSQRERFITNSLKHLQSVIDKGVPVKGYIHWTLLDNFEWVSGYEPKFGLHTVDRKTFERKPKPSALAYSKILKQNRVQSGMLTLCASSGACSQISIIMLEKAQANYALRAVHLAKGDHKTAEYLAVNPKGKVPALLTDTGVITETPAILLFLHAHYPDAGILPADINNVEAVSDLAWFASFFHPLITRYCKPDLLGVTTDVDAVKHVAASQLKSAYQTAEKRLKASPYWYGDDWSATDAYLFWTVNRLKRAGFDFSAFEYVIQHYQQMLASPVIKRALLKEKALQLNVYRKQKRDA